jgi:predicted RNase H-like HicB family nuclease
MTTELMTAEKAIVDRDAKFHGFAPGTAFQCRIAIVKEADGFSAHAEQLPGVVSEGDTEAEALDQVAEACEAALKEYLASGQPIPWSDAKVEGDVVFRRWIVVRV